MRHPMDIDMEAAVRGRQFASAEELMRRLAITNAINESKFHDQGDAATMAAGEWMDACFMLDELRGRRDDYIGWSGRISSAMMVAWAITFVISPRHSIAVVMGWLIAIAYHALRMRVWCRHNAEAYGRVAERTMALEPFLSSEATIGKG